MVPSKRGTFTPSPAQQKIETGISHSPHGSHHGPFSAGASPSTSSPTGSSALAKIVVAQVYLLLSTIKEDKDRAKWEQQAEQIRKLVDEYGMDIFPKYFIRLVVGNAGLIFPGSNRPLANPGNYEILVREMHQITHDVNHARNIAESIENANEDIFRDFDLSTFMDHFKLDALEKAILAVAFKIGSRSDLKTKADAILSANYTPFLQALVAPAEDENISDEFLATILDRYIQYPPPTFNEQAKKDLELAISYRFAHLDRAPPATVLSALYLRSLLDGTNALASYIQQSGNGFTVDEETCRSLLQNFAGEQITEQQVSAALLYTAISRSPSFSPSILVSSLHAHAPDLQWSSVITCFDQLDLRVSKEQFLELYQALRPLAVDGALDVQRLWGGQWANSETQLSFINAFTSLTSEELDASTIPNLQPAFTLAEFSHTESDVQERAAAAVKHPLVSVVALSAMFNVALNAPMSSDTTEAKRLFQDVVVPNLDIFLVSAFGVPKPWPELALDTVNNLFDRFLYKYDPNYDFVLEGLWRKDQSWVVKRLIETHAKIPNDLNVIIDHAVRHNWVEILTSRNTGFSIDMASVASGRNLLDLDDWAKKQKALRNNPPDFAQAILTFLNIKAQHELDFQRQGNLCSVPLTVRTVWQLLHILEDLLPQPKTPSHDLIIVQRACITAYPRLINYDQGFDDIIDANGETSNSLPKESVAQMEEHYKRMYSDEVQVRAVVDALEEYKHSRNPVDQDIFACMIHGLFDEYALYHTYPLEALATTAVLFGGIISHRLIDDLPLQIGLGMILEAVRDYTPSQSMYKFGLQALMQLFPRLREWPGFCTQLLQIPGLQGTEAWTKAEEATHYQQEADRNAPPGINGGITNGESDELPAPALSPFSSLHVDPPLYVYEDPEEEVQDKIQFVLNNITNENLDTKFAELKDVINEQNEQWFAGHLVHERAKMQPNFHELYLNLVKLLSKKSLWAELLRETYVCTFRSLNSEATFQNALDRQHLKNLAVWLGALTLARDKPIKHKNIAFKQLLAEGLDTQRLIVVIPFVCKVLAQGKNSTVFRPPNPWIMDIVKALMELYHKPKPAEIKLNLKFEIEVLCQELGLDRKTIEPSDELLNRIPDIDPGEIIAPESLDRFENMSLNGLHGGVGGGRFSPQDITSSIPDLGPLLHYPPANDMVNQGRLQEIMRTAITRAVHEIISPVVERSVTIAAISTAQMIHKDFATESSEARLRSAAINMVKKTAGALALVTSKEPLRASMTNYIRAMSGELPQGLPEGTIIMCVNSNLDLACSQVEKKAEERAVPEIEEMIEPELEARRVHRQSRPDEPYVDPGLSRWSWTIPQPYKLQPTMGGLNQEQMNIYDEFARQPRIAAPIAATTHGGSTSDATRSMANDILQDQYPAVPNLSTPAEPPAMPHLSAQQPAYAQPNAIMANGRLPSLPLGPTGLIERVQKTLMELERAARDTPELHYHALRAPSPVLDVLDQLFTLVIRGSQGPEPLDAVVVEFICKMLFGNDLELVVESLVHVLQNICRMPGRTAQHVHNMISHQAGDSLLHVPLAVALVEADMVDWQRIDQETTKAIKQRKEEAIQFLSALLDRVLLNNRPIALYADFASSLEAAWQWIEEDPTLEIGQQLKEKLTSSGLPHTQGANNNDERLTFMRDLMGYVFEEWVRLCNNPNASEKAALEFMSQLYNRQVINDRDDLCLFLRLSIETSVDRFESQMHSNGSIGEAYIPIDSLARLVVMLVKGREQEGEVRADKGAYLKSILSLVVLILNHHHVMRGELFNQKVFFRLMSTMLCEFSSSAEHFSDAEYQEILVVFAHIFLQIRPSYFPGFLLGWLSLISHRNFLPLLLRLPDQAGWGPCAEILQGLMCFIGQLLKPLQITGPTKDIYRAVLKLLVMLHHDFPDFLAANHSQLGANIPSHCVQLHNLILTANPEAYKMPDPLQPGLKIDRVEEIRLSPDNMNDVQIPLRQIGLLDVLDRALETGPSEDAVAHIAHAIQKRKSRQSGLGFVPISVDLQLVESLVVYIGVQSIARAEQKGAPTFVPGTPDVALLSMLVHELNPEARYYFISSIINQLRFPSTHTHYFSQALLNFFDNDVNDPEELDIRQQVTRILLERLLGQWPHPWGLIVTVQELVKNEQYMFFELPFIKSSPDIGERFLALAQRG